MTGEGKTTYITIDTASTHIYDRSIFYLETGIIITCGGVKLVA
jgi:hypothetical protein